MIPDELRRSLGAFKFYTLALVVLALVAYGSFLAGNEYSDYQLAKIAKLEQTIGNLSAENARITRDLNILGVETEVQRIAALKSQQIIELGLDREAELKKELAFFQKIMAPELQQEGFIIDAFNLNEALSESAFRFEIVLIQQDLVKNMVTGNLEVTLKGSQNGKPVQYSLKNLLQNQATELTFGFRFFQIIEGQLILPEGFSPEKVIVAAEIFQFKRKRGDLERTFDWDLS